LHGYILSELELGSAQHLKLESIRQMRELKVMLQEGAEQKFKTGITGIMFGKYDEESTLCN
jgi:hypothetical protein